MHECGAEMNDESANCASSTHYEFFDYENYLAPFLNDYSDKHNLGIPDLRNPTATVESVDAEGKIKEPHIHSWLDMA